jgi:anti-sigma regulatory factor (Ser/Thr protein kinase)
MEVMRSTAVRVSDPSKIAEARRVAVQHARNLEWDDVTSGEVALIATELATNLVKHAQNGAVILNSSNGGERASLQMISVDTGPGITDIDRSLRDGYSTAGSPGNGLGAVRRMARTLDVYSTPQGTVLVAEIDGLRLKSQGRRKAYTIGGIAVPRAGESVCGDAWDVRSDRGLVAVLLVDGLGHGSAAAKAADAAVESFRSAAAISDPVDLMNRLDLALRPTRGAAAAVAVIDAAAAIVRYCGIGNTVGAIVARNEKRSLVSLNGTLGHTVPRVGEFSYPWPAGASLVMHSDGLTARWVPEQWPGLWQREPAIVAGALYRDCHRPRDDATVVVTRIP